jgi:lipopolysaccharide export system permease protein
MLVIERYILRRMLVIFLAGLFGVVGIVWTAQVISRINLVTDNGQSIGGFLYLSLFAIPSVIPVVAPFAFALSAAHTLNVLNADSELVVINASGAPRMTVLRPLLLFATAVAIGAFAIANVVEPRADEKRRRLIVDARSDLISNIIQEGTFRKVDENLFLQIAERRGDGSLGGIFVSDSRDEKADLIYYAKSGIVARRDQGDLLVLSDGEIFRKPPGGNVSMIKFNTYAFDLTEFTASTGEITLSPRNRPLSYLLSPDPKDKFLTKYPGMFVAEIHARLTDWLYPLAFALVAFAVAGDARSHRGARINPVVTVVAIALIMRWLGFIAYNGADEGGLAFVWLYVIPLAAMGVAIFFISTNRSMELPPVFAEKSRQALDALIRLGQGASGRMRSGSSRTGSDAA